MTSPLALALALLAPFAAPPAAARPLIPPVPAQEATTDGSRKKLIAAADEVAKLGDPALVEAMETALRAAGLREELIEERRRLRWTRTLEKAKTPAKASTRKSAARRIVVAVRALDEDLVTAPGDEARNTVANVILALDSDAPAAHEALGHEKVGERYLDEAGVALEARLAEIDAAARAAMALEIEVKHTAPSTSKLVKLVRGDDSHEVEARGFVLHGGVAPDRLERALRQGLRALAFTNWLKTGEVDLPRFGKKIELFITDDFDEFDRSFEIARENGLIEKRSYAYENGGSMGSFPTARDVYVARWLPENAISADVVWFGASRILPRSIEPFLFAGHTNWLCLRFFGCSKPAAVWQDAVPADERTTTKPRVDDDAMWRAASSGLFGARSYLRRKVEDGATVTVADAILDQEGKVSGVPLLIATIVTEYLQIGERFFELAKVQTKDGDVRVRNVEEGLGASIPDFDADWIAYLMGGGSAPGVLQRVSGAAGDAEAQSDPVGEAAVAHLDAIREATYTARNIWREDLRNYPELSQNAAKHAAYLQKNPEQKQAWPDAHEEYADKEGFSPEGAWAGGHSVIAFDGDVEDAIDSLLATFYHRLPLLEPGLCGIGAAVDGDVVVLDSGSLLNRYISQAYVAFPHDGQKNVPLRFQPEHPHPVPGEDQGSWGYPITVQAYWSDRGKDATVELELFVDGSDTPVDCHFISPEKSFQPRSRPKDAYCLIPKAHLSAGTKYRVKARISALGDSFEWTFRTGAGR